MSEPLVAWKAQAKVKLIQAIIDSAQRGDFEAVRQDAVIGRALFQPVPAVPQNGSALTAWLDGVEIEGTPEGEDEDPTAGFTYPSDR